MECNKQKFQHYEISFNVFEFIWVHIGTQNKTKYSKVLEHNSFFNKRNLMSFRPKTNKYTRSTHICCCRIVWRFLFHFTQYLKMKKTTKVEYITIVRYAEVSIVLFSWASSWFYRNRLSMLCSRAFTIIFCSWLSGCWKKISKIGTRLAPKKKKNHNLSGIITGRDPKIQAYFVNNYVIIVCIFCERAKNTKKNKVFNGDVMMVINDVCCCMTEPK